MDRERQVLVHANVAPPDLQRVGIRALEGLDPFDPLHGPPLVGAREVDGRHHLPLSRVTHLPTTHVMTARHHAWPNALGHPRLDDEVADGGFYSHEAAGGEPEARGVGRVDPERIGVRDLIEPLGVATARVNLHGQPERGDQRHLPRREVLGVNVTLDVRRQRVLGPAPVGHRA
jgi:hypothetical protein